MFGKTLSFQVYAQIKKEDIDDLSPLFGGYALNEKCVNVGENDKIDEDT